MANNIEIAIEAQKEYANQNNCDQICGDGHLEVVPIALSIVIKLMGVANTVIVDGPCQKQDNANDDQN